MIVRTPVGRLCELALVTLLFAVSIAAAQESEELEGLLREANELDVRLHELLRTFPSDYDFERERRAILDVAEKLEVAGVRAEPVAGIVVLTSDSGEETPVDLHRIRLTGTAPYVNLHSLVSTLLRRPRLTRLETLQMHAAAGGVEFDAELYLPVMSDDLGSDEGIDGELVSTLRRKLERDRLTLDLVAELVDAAESDRRLESLAAFSNAASAASIAVTDVLVSRKIQIEGVVLGARAESVLRESVGRGGLSNVGIDFIGEAGCYRYSIVALAGRPSDEQDAFPIHDLFDAESLALCPVAGEPRLAPIVLAGKDDTPVLQLREVDLADVFFILQDLFAFDSVVDSNVRGMISIEAGSSTGIDELLAAIGTVVHVSDGGLRRVSVEPQSLPQGSWSGEPVTLSFRRASLRDVLCLFEQVGGKALHIPETSEERVTVFADEIPHDQMLSALLASSSLPSQDELRKKGTPTACAGRTEDGTHGRRLSPSALRLDELGPDDLTLAGVALLGSIRRAYVYAPGRLLRALEPGQQLYEATVSGIEPSGVTLQTPDGVRTLELPTIPLPD